MKKALALVVVLAIALLSAATCEISNNIRESPALIGISMPRQTSVRWTKDGDIMTDILTGRGYNVDLQFAENDVPTQKQQVEAMLAKGAKVLVIAAVDSSALSSILDRAAEDGVSVISYDRLLVDTAAVSYYATFDNFGVGVLQAQSLIDGLREKKGPGPYNIELFAGSPDDTNSGFFFKGAESVLRSLIDSGEVTVVSGLTTQEQVGIIRWDGAIAETRMDAILDAYYSAGKPLHGVLSPSDGISRGIISAFYSFGFEPGNDNWPVVTGQDAEAESIKMITTGEQYSTVFKDTRELARMTADMVEAVLEDRAPVINDTTTYNNNVKIVPSYLLVPYIVHADNYKQLIIGSGYLTEDDIR